MQTRRIVEQAFGGCSSGRRVSWDPSKEQGTGGEVALDFDERSWQREAKLLEDGISVPADPTGYFEEEELNRITKGNVQGGRAYEQEPTHMNIEDMERFDHQRRSRRKRWCVELNVGMSPCPCTPSELPVTSNTILKQLNVPEPTVQHCRTAILRPYKPRGPEAAERKSSYTRLDATSYQTQPLTHQSTDRPLPHRRVAANSEGSACSEATPVPADPRSKHPNSKLPSVTYADSSLGAYWQQARSDCSFQNSQQQTSGPAGPNTSRGYTVLERKRQHLRG
ncbi:UNVERIFIED_CONTAM: hypothetical protein HHA_453260 [Hammondia hammondi]|eukprot:XP_008886507.1 hypothetical protein HHA_453260 [Hammondia hammondi]